MVFPSQEEQQKQRTEVESHGMQLIVPDSAGTPCKPLSNG